MRLDPEVEWTEMTTEHHDRRMWSPSNPSGSAMARFARAVDGEASAAGDLHRWSIAEPEAFWAAVWQHCGVIGERGTRVIESHQFMPSTRFFPEASLSVVENIVHRSGPADALVAVDEQGNRRSRSWDDLRERVARLAGALSQAGVGEGDRVVAWLATSIEAVEVMLAAASLGAVYSSSSPDFGVSGVLDRFGQIGPTVLVAQDGYWYNGKYFDCLDRLEHIVAGLPSHPTRARTRANSTSSNPWW
ncbi:MAG: AMP-binding protein [Ilumatobacteraceae bacterium]